MEKMILPIQILLLVGIAALIWILLFKREIRRGIKSLSLSEERYKALIETAQEGIIVVDPQEYIIFLNNKFVDMLGFSKEELLGRSLESLISKQDSERLLNETKKRRNGISSRYEMTFITKDNIPKKMLVSASPYYDEYGDFQGTWALLTDISDLVKTEKALRASEDRYKNLFENFPVGIYLCDTNGNFIAVNFALLKMLGYSSKEEFMSHNIVDFCVNKKDISKLRRGIKHKNVYSDELLLQKKDNAIIIASLIINKTTDLAGNIVFQGILQDITEQKKFQEHVLQSQKLEVISNLAKGFIHDIKNLLTPIKGYTSLIELKLKDEDREYTNKIKQSIERIEELSERLLVFSKAKKYHPKVIDPVEVIEDALKLAFTGYSNISINKNYSTERGKIKVEVGQFHQVIMSICDNARDAMPDGGDFNITIGNVKIDKNNKLYENLPLNNDYIKISFSDTGKGMDEKTILHIFEPFFSTKKYGSGLGLSVAYRIIKNHNGYIDVYSKLGEGTTFNIYLPIA
ncbi:MAG: hypothetical protein DRH57_07175 [Candidatus Cloacimonadota bacterium]|nr:MAG: hypothetical protein DRH57_07175 [Candidatus Cloacimonadota bacterium]